MDQYEDPISHFRQYVEEENQKTERGRWINGDYPEYEGTLTVNSRLTRNVGYIAVKRIYRALKLDQFWKKHLKGRKIRYDFEGLFFLLVAARLLDPGSKKYSFEKKDQFFEPLGGFKLEDVYEAFDVIADHNSELQAWIFHQSKNLIERQTDICYYDGTNYYFDIGRPDVDEVDDQGNITDRKLRKRGAEKNKRPDPIVNMGLLIDKKAIPIAYDIYPGNESEKVHMLPVINQARQHLMINRIINVADRGLNTSENIWHLAGNNTSSNPESMDGYVFGKSVKGADEEFKAWALDRSSFVTEYLDPDPICSEDEDHLKDSSGKDKVKFEYKIRNHVAKLTVHVEMPDGTIKKKITSTDQRQLVYYSEKYAMKQKRDREVMLERARDLIRNPTKYDRVTAAGSASYIKNIKFNKETGEIVGNNLILDEEKIAEEEKYDGFYSIVTSELKLSGQEIRNIYRGLIRIEHTFRITKSEMEVRPIFVKTTDHIRAHFSTCYAALCILKILMELLDNKYSARKILNSLNECTVSEIGNSIWQFNYYDEVLNDIAAKLDLNLDHRYRTREQIRRLLQY